MSKYNKIDHLSSLNNEKQCVMPYSLINYLLFLMEKAVISRLLAFCTIVSILLCSCTSQSNHLMKNCPQNVSLREQVNCLITKSVDGINAIEATASTGNDTHDVITALVNDLYTSLFTLENLIQEDFNSSRSQIDFGYIAEAKNPMILLLAQKCVISARQVQLLTSENNRSLRQSSSIVEELKENVGRMKNLISRSESAGGRG